MDEKNLPNLAKMAASGDKNAMESLYRETSHMVYYTALKLTGSPQDAEDLAQEAYVHILEGLSALRDPQAAPKWMKQVVVNLSKNHLKKKRPYLFRTEEEEAAALGTLTEESFDALPDVYVDDAAKRKLITDMIDALPERQRLTIYLYYYAELPIRQIAAITEVSEGTVKSRLNAGRQAIKADVEREERRGNKLYALLPLLGSLLTSDAEAAPISEAFRCAALSAAGAGAATGAATASSAEAALSVSAGTGSAVGGALATKVIAGALAVTFLGGGVAGVIALTRRTDPAPLPTAVQAQPSPPIAPTSSIIASPTPAPEPESPAIFDPMTMLGADISALTALFGEAQGPTNAGTRNQYEWSPDGAYLLATTMPEETTIVELVFSAGLTESFLGLTTASTEADIAAALKPLGSNYFVRDTGPGQKGYAAGDGSLMYQVYTQDGVITTFSIHQNA